MQAAQSSAVVAINHEQAVQQLVRSCRAAYQDNAGQACNVASLAHPLFSTVQQLSAFSATKHQDEAHNRFKLLLIQGTTSMLSKSAPQSAAAAGLMVLYQHTW
eukprot:GHUV01055026.1.p2 GENE.GHUV01055026.1~~GHUV01055026.1.p2  ORF type:complete len:103 (+),score=12.98 GHUV01055026.1:430-738(+)